MLARQAAARRIPGWEALGTTRDPAERVWLRLALAGGIAEHDDAEREQEKRLIRHAEGAVQTGVAKAFR